jgi:hypothetical protein
VADNLINKMFRTVFAMLQTKRRLLRLKAALISCLMLVGVGSAVPSLFVQETFPAPPADRTLVYVSSERGALAALPFEVGTTPLRIEAVAGSDKRSYVELKGESAATVLTFDDPRFYLYVPDQKDIHPPFLVRLTVKGKARRVTALAQKGQRGYAISSEEIIMPHYRVLGREGGMLYMELRARQPLVPGEYALIGSDLARIATFHVAGESNR